MTQPGLPQPNSPQFGAKLREIVLVGLGLTNNRQDTFVRVRDLQDAGIATPHQVYIRNGSGKVLNGPGSSVQPAYVVDLTPPPTPTGFSASAGTVNILFQTDPPVYTQGNGHAKTRIYAANYSGGPLPTFSSAVEFTSFVGNIAAAPFDPASNLRLWVKWESVDGVLSPPAGGTNGISALTNLVDDAKIANLSAGKILAGSLSVGQYIQSADYVAGTSGWRIQTLSGGGAYLEINGGATIGGITVGATYLQSNSYVLNTSGFKLNSNGTGQIGGFQIGTNYIQSSNYVAGTTGWKLAYDGTGQLRVATLDALSANFGTITAGIVRNSTDSVHMDFNATGSSLVLRAGASTNYGPYAGTHYPVEIYANGSAFFGRGVVAGGQLKASGTYTIPNSERPAVLFYAAAPPYSDLGGAGP